MDKVEILREIKRTAGLNGGRPLGKARFADETGITESDWFGKYWKSWGDALTEAGLTPNKLQGALDDELLFTSILALTRELGRFPVMGDLRLKRRRDKSFPSHGAFFRRLGKK